MAELRFGKRSSKNAVELLPQSVDRQLVNYLPDP